MLNILTKRFGNKHASKLAVIAVTVFILAAVVLSFVFSLLPSSLRMPDMTANSMYTLSAESLKTLQSTYKKVELYLIAAEENVNQTIKVFMERYACKSKSITFSLLDPEKDIYTIHQYVSDDPTPNSVLVICGDDFRYIDYYELFSFSAKSYQLAYIDYYQATMSNPTLASVMDMKTYAVEMGLYDEFVYESKITAAIKYLTTENTEKICVLSGHGESNVTYDLISRAGDDCIGFNIVDADTNAIPEGTECIFIVCTTDITENEATRLAEFMDNGGKVVALTGFGYNVPKFYALAEKYGLISENKLVCDDSEGSNYGSTPHAIIPQTLSQNINNILTNNEASLVLSTCTPINISDNVPNGITVTPLISTSDKAYLKSATATSLEFNEATDTRGTRHIGVKSENSNGGGLIWFSSFTFILDAYDIYSSFGNKLVMIDVFNEATDNALRNAIPPVSRATASLEVPIAFTITFMVIVCAVIPLALIAICIVKRKKLYTVK